MKLLNAIPMGESTCSQVWYEYNSTFNFIRALCQVFSVDIFNTYIRLNFIGTWQTKYTDIYPSYTKPSAQFLGLISTFLYKLQIVKQTPIEWYSRDGPSP